MPQVRSALQFGSNTAQHTRSMEMRARVLEFLILAALQLEIRPIVKYSALSLFADRLLPALARIREGNENIHWLLKPVRESSLQLFSLVSIWISSKMYDSPPLSVKCLKSFSDKTIKEQHFTTRDFSEAEVVLMQVLNFELGTSNNTFNFLEELLVEFKEVAKVGELMSFSACMDIMDILYEEEDISILCCSPYCLAGSILVASYVITVPKQTWEFPVLPWVKSVTSCTEEDVLRTVRAILKHIFGPSH